MSENKVMAALQIDQLLLTDKPVLRMEWQKAFGTPPPARLSNKFMQLALGWRIQTLGGNGFARETTKILQLLKKQASASNLPKNNDARGYARNKASSHGNSLTPGTSLVREWNDVVHKVLVIEEGFVWNDTTWSSLSAIAREITGARWNGPAFFGLRSNRTGGSHNGFSEAPPRAGAAL